MMESLEQELAVLVDEDVPPLIDAEELIDMAELERLVRQDEAAELFDGECLVHEGCKSVVWRFS